VPVIPWGYVRGISSSIQQKESNYHLLSLGCIIGLSVIQLTKSGTAGTADPAELARQFERSHVFRMPRLLHSELMQLISSRLECCAWTTRDDGAIAREDLPADAAPAGVLHLATNTPEFLSLIRRITRCEQIKWFGGRVYRMSPAADHFDSWHADIGISHGNRLVGMSINLSPRPYQGGVFRVRDEASGEVLCELPNTDPGDAIFFRISPNLEHMVTPLVGTEPKIAFAGWFHSGGADFYSMLRSSAVASTD
jgi:hypothetical protein